MFYQSKSRNVLSRRELEVLQLLCQGASTKEIAQSLFISAYTVTDHRKNIRFKLDAKSAFEMGYKAGQYLYATTN